VPPSVLALSAKYDETRSAKLGPLLHLLADELSAILVPKLTREGEAAKAVVIAEGVAKLREPGLPVMPQEGKPFSPDAFALVQASDEWKRFVVSFTEAETALNESYQRALDREKAVFQEKGDPYGVIAVENEAKRVAAIQAGHALAAAGKDGASVGSPSGASTTGTPPPSPANPDGLSTGTMKTPPRKMEDRFVKKMVRYHFKDDIFDFYFRPRGEVVRRITKPDDSTVMMTGSWEIEDDGSVVVTGIHSTKWFWFGDDGRCEMRQGEKEGKRESKIEFVPGAKDPER